MRSFGEGGNDPLSWNGGTEGEGGFWLCYAEHSLEVKEVAVETDV